MSELTKIYCPKCQQPIEGDAELFSQGVLCPTCGAEFYPREGKEAASALESRKTKPRNAETDKMRDRADDFKRGAILLLIISVLAFWFGIALAIMASSGAFNVLPSSGAFSVCLICFKAAVVFYVIYLLIHIRANTEK